MKILKRIILGVLLLVVILSVAVYFFLKGTLPVLKGTFSAPPGETTGIITIDRDPWGVPLIRAENELDLFWAAGFVHASDRLFQMDLIRRLSTGRLSEVFGRRALESDIEQMDMMIGEGIDRTMEQISPDIILILENYCRGVNHYIESRPLPPEFRLLGYAPGPWTVRDMLAVFKRMEVILAGSGSELYNMKLAAALGKEKASQLLSGVNGATIINDEEYASFPVNATLLSAFEREVENLDKFVGSNNWVISGSGTVSGKPILCNDPHLSNVFPSYFYQINMKAPGLELSGNTIPGVPFIVIGRNAHLSWGFTNVGTDVIDYYILKTDPAQEGKYFIDGEWKAFNVIEKRIKIKGEEDHIHNVLVSDFGPVIKEGEIYMAVHSVNEYPSTVIEAVRGMNYADDAGTFLEALKKFSSPAQNVVFADDRGNIGYFPTGLVPVRAEGDGSMPLRGESIRQLWKGFYDENKKPHVINPRKGFIVTANNRVIPETGVPVFARDWFPSFRADRITELLDRDEKLSVEDNIRFQTDTRLKSAEFLLSRLKDHKPLSPGSASVLEALLKWDLRADSGSAPALFYRFEKTLSNEMFSDEFKDEEGKKLVSRAWIYRLLNYPSGKAELSIADEWADDRRTDKTETFSDIIERSLSLTHEDPDRRQDDRNGWEEVHQLTYRHPLGSVFMLKNFLNRGPFGMKGGKDCVMVASFGNRDDFSVSHLSTFRMIIDMGDQTNSRMINSSGQSGHFMSRFYDDQIDLYVRGGYRSMESVPEGKHRIIVNPGGKK